MVGVTYGYTHIQATDDTLLGKTVAVKGWVRTKRDQKTFSFVEVNDGSCMKGVQVRLGGREE